MLHWAVDREQTAVVEELLKREASPNIQDADGMTALHYAASCDHEEMAQLLVRFMIMKSNNFAVVVLADKVLCGTNMQVDHGALTGIEDGDGDTPASVASSERMQTILASGKR